MQHLTRAFYALCNSLIYNAPAIRAYARATASLLWLFPIVAGLAGFYSWLWSIGARPDGWPVEPGVEVVFWYTLVTHWAMVVGLIRCVARRDR